MIGLQSGASLPLNGGHGSSPPPPPPEGGGAFGVRLAEPCVPEEVPFAPGAPGPRLPALAPGPLKVPGLAVMPQALPGFPTGPPAPGIPATPGSPPAPPAPGGPPATDVLGTGPLYE